MEKSETMVHLIFIKVEVVLQTPLACKEIINIETWLLLLAIVLVIIIIEWKAKIKILLLHAKIMPFYLAWQEVRLILHKEKKSFIN